MTINIESGIVFIVSHIDVEGLLPLEIISHHVFRKANNNEIENINRILSTSVSDFSKLLWVRYDSVVTAERHNDNRTSYHYEKLPQDKWKYWVIAFEGTNNEIRNLENAFILLETDIDFGFQIFFTGPNQSGNAIGHTNIPLHLVEKYTSSEFTQSNAKEITTEELKKVSIYYRLQKDISSAYLFIDHAIKNFSSIRRIPKQSELLIVGYFSIIEALITHTPRLTETLDSISHQIGNKMILLRKKYSKEINCSTYFLESKEETIWKKLYSYRSCLAHGDVPDFVNKFQILKNHEAVTSFLKENIKELIIFALKEPEFIADLRKC